MANISGGFLGFFWPIIHKCDEEECLKVHNFAKTPEFHLEVWVSTKANLKQFALYF